MKFPVIDSIADVISKTHEIPNEFLLKLVSQSECTDLAISTSFDLEQYDGSLCFIIAKFGDAGLVQFAIKNDLIVENLFKEISKELNKLGDKGQETFYWLETNFNTAGQDLGVFSNLVWRILCKTLGFHESIAQLTVSSSDSSV